MFRLLLLRPFYPITKSFTHPAVLPVQPPTFSPSMVTRPSPLPPSSSHPPEVHQELPFTWRLQITGPLSSMISFQGLSSVSVPGVAVIAHYSPLLKLVRFSTERRRDGTDGTSEQERKCVSTDGATPCCQQTLLIILISWSNESLLLQIVSFV